MQRLLYIIFLSFFLLVSCAKQKPKGILSESKMTDLLTEVSLIDSYLNMLPIDSGRTVMPVLYDNLFKEFDIDSNQFKQNMDFYYGNPILTEKIYKNIDVKLKEFEGQYRVEDSIRNVFVTDSIRRVSRIQQLDAERRSVASNYYKNANPYNYKEYAEDFYRRAELNMNVYGVQVPAMPIANIALVPEEPIMRDSTMMKYLNTPIQKLLLNGKSDSSQVDFRILNILFLKNSGLHVRTGFTYNPVIKSLADTTSISTAVDSLGQDSLLRSKLVRDEIPKVKTDSVIRLKERSVNPKTLLKPVK